MSTDQEQLSQDEVFDLLSSPRRRYVLYYLRDTGEPIGLTSLAEEVAAWENDTTVEDITQQERKRVYVSLYQTHIPRLVDAGLVAHDSDSGAVTLEKEIDQIDQYLDSPESSIAWEWVYLVLTGAGVLLFGLVTITDLGGSDSNSVLVLGILAAFLLTAVAHAVHHVQRSRSIPSELRDRL